ncbi:MAG TPA: amylo-alpha-1,6-glucosidase [Vicinamibacterales bacterium]|nr:amylo-alpha-1,6-glucosidase [Vicinamibacterales bacterium]
MNDVQLLRRIPWPPPAPAEDPEITREWLITNGLGGYASGTVSGIVTRRYHGVLIAALPAPLGRVVVLNHLLERVKLRDGRTFWLADEPTTGTREEAHALKEFRLELGLPVWRYQVDGVVLEKRMVMPFGQNTVHVCYLIVDGDGPVRLTVRPSLHFRPHEAPVSEQLQESYRFLVHEDDRFELSAGSEWPTLRLTPRGVRTAFTVERRMLPEVLYATEESRGYAARGALWSPGYFRAELELDRAFSLIASTEDWGTIEALDTDEAFDAERQRRRRLLSVAPPAAREGIGAELVLAADQFIIHPAGRGDEGARARAQGDEVRTVIAGYHWFTDWGRDTMISLEGLTLSTGRAREAGYIIRTFAHYVRDGLIPNMFPEGDRDGLYHTADATMWFFHAIDRYVTVTGDRETLGRLLPTLVTIVERHIEGTRFRIGMDPRDALLRQGAEGYQLTWMDAKVDGWVVTPRRGKAVEINALWYNALTLLDRWMRERGGCAGARDFGALAARVRESFNRRFWYDDGDYLYDVVDGEQADDPACRPNQILAVSLPNAVLDPSRWAAVFGVVRKQLETPVGLRSLAPGHPDYKPKYYGDLRTRDAAYHQGTVWAWLVGPYIDAWLKVRPDEHVEARRYLEGMFHTLDEACIGSISEIFDAEAPFTPRGCIAQAWSVAEALRCWVKTSEARERTGSGPVTVSVSPAPLAST